MTSPPALMGRLSSLASGSFTPGRVHLWIREVAGCPAIRSPGNHFRLRLADVRTFCEREGLPVPSFVSPPAPRVVIGAGPLLRCFARSPGRSRRSPRSIRSATPLRGTSVAAAAEPTRILALGAQERSFDGVAAVRALRSTPATSGVIVIAFGVPSRPRALALEKAGALQAIAAAQTRDLLPEALVGALTAFAPGGTVA